MALQLTVPKMACSACVNTITKAVKTVDPNAMVQAEPKTKLVSVETQAVVLQKPGWQVVRWKTASVHSRFHVQVQPVQVAAR